MPRLPACAAMAALGLLAAPAALAGLPEAPELLDPDGDVYVGGTRQLASGLYADVVDVQAVWFDRPTGDSVQLLMRVASMDEPLERSLQRDYVAQYAVTFVSAEAPAGFQVHASFAGVLHNPLNIPYGWTFGILDRGSGQWAQATGRVVEETRTIVWSLPRAAIGAGDGAVLRELGAQAWAPDEKGDHQLDDWAGAPGRGYDFRPGPAPWRLPPEPGKDLEVPDDAADVISDDEPLAHPAANLVDFRDVRFHDPTAEAFSISTHVASFAAIEDLAWHANSAVQYAVSFTAAQHPLGYSSRADLRLGEEEASWRFQVHDRGTDVWTDTEGAVDLAAGTFTVHIPRALVGAEAPDARLVFDGASAWVYGWDPADPDRQAGDWADLDAAEYVPGPGAAPAPSAPLSAAGMLRQASGPEGLVLLLGAAALALVVRGRRP